MVGGGRGGVVRGGVVAVGGGQGQGEGGEDEGLEWREGTVEID